MFKCWVRLTYTIGLLLTALLAPFDAYLGGAQSPGTGALGGTVADASGGVIESVNIKVINQANGATYVVTTQGDGRYFVPLLPPGLYRMEASKTGFKNLEQNNVHVNVTETAVLNLQLQVGKVEQTIVVQGREELLQTESSTLGRVINTELVSSLPLVTRNYTQIIGLSPGVSANVTNAADIGRGSGGTSGSTGFAAHGGATNDNNYQMNGLEINDISGSGSGSGGAAIPNPDSIQQFKVQTGQYDASYGRNAGANVNVVTKSGSNDFHGSAFEFLRNDALNANDFFRNKIQQPRPVLKQNQFGFALGGPIKKDKVLFFTSYQGTRQVNGLGGGFCVSNFSMPPLTNNPNDRTAAGLGRLFAGQTGALGAGMGGANTIKADGSNISAQAVALMNLKLPDGRYLIPTPQSIDPSKPFLSQGFSALSAPCRFSEDQFMVNADFRHTSKSTFSEHFFWANSDQISPLPPTNLGGPPSPGFPVLSPNEFRVLSLNHTYAFVRTY